MVTRIQKKIADGFMRMQVHKHIKDTYFKRGVTPTVEQVIMDIDEKALNILLAQGYTIEEIRSMTVEVINRQNAKNRMSI